jgi:hypothetical protein
LVVPFFGFVVKQWRSIMLSRHDFIVLAMCAALVAGTQSAAVGAEPAAKPAPAVKAASPDTTTSPVSSGQRVAIDPATGQMRAPTAAEAAELDRQDRVARSRLRLTKSDAAATQQLPAGVESLADDGTFTTPDGAKGMILDDSQMVYSVVTRGADGRLQMECVEGVDSANKLLQRKAAPAAARPVAATRESGHEHK